MAELSGPDAGSQRARSAVTRGGHGDTITLASTDGRQATEHMFQLLVGGIVSVCNIAIHALVMTSVVRVARTSGKRTSRPSLRLTSVMIATVLVLMAAHVIEVLVWSLAYWLTGAAPAGSSLVYFAFVNYTTLGYGDVTPVEAWQLLGPITAMNGVILFGWSTAVIFAVLQRAMTHDTRTDAPGSRP